MWERFKKAGFFVSLLAIVVFILKIKNGEYQEISSSKEIGELLGL